MRVVLNEHNNNIVSVCLCECVVYYGCLEASKEKMKRQKINPTDIQWGKEQLKAPTMRIELLWRRHSDTSHHLLLLFLLARSCFVAQRKFIPSWIIQFVAHFITMKIRFEGAFSRSFSIHKNEIKIIKSAWVLASMEKSVAHWTIKNQLTSISC